MSFLAGAASSTVYPPLGGGTAGAPLLKCGLQPFCGRGLRPEEGKVAHPRGYSSSWSLYFEITLSNAGNKQNPAVWEHEKNRGTYHSQPLIYASGQVKRKKEIEAFFWERGFESKNACCRAGVAGAVSLG